MYSAHASGPRARLHAAEIDPAVQAAALHLDPIADRDEYAALAAFLSRPDLPTIEGLNDSDLPEARRLGQRLANLGVDRYTVWPRDKAGSVLDAVHDESLRCVVIDLGSLPTREEQSLVAAQVLGDLWRGRAERRPVLIVIDEAHNVSPAKPPDRLAALAADHVIRIAAEGRKYGLYLLVSTQRPQKIPENVLSQADNLVLLRLNSLADAAFAQAVFSFVPPGLVERSATFRQGEGLIAGRISPEPALLRFGARISEEGGADVPATWAPASSPAESPPPSHVLAAPHPGQGGEAPDREKVGREQPLDEHGRDRLILRDAGAGQAGDEAGLMTPAPPGPGTAPPTMGARVMTEISVVTLARCPTACSEAPSGRTTKLGQLERLARRRSCVARAAIVSTLAEMATRWGRILLLASSL